MTTNALLLSIDIIMALIVLAFGVIRGQFSRALNFVFFAAVVVVCGSAIMYLGLLPFIFRLALIFCAGVLLLSFIRLIQVDGRSA